MMCRSLRAALFESPRDDVVVDASFCLKVCNCFKKSPRVLGVAEKMFCRIREPAPR